MSPPCKQFVWNLLSWFQVNWVGHNLRLIWGFLSLVTLKTKKVQSKSSRNYVGSGCWAQEHAANGIPANSDRWTEGRNLLVVMVLPLFLFFLWHKLWSMAWSTGRNNRSSSSFCDINCGRWPGQQIQIIHGSIQSISISEITISGDHLQNSNPLSYILQTI